MKIHARQRETPLGLLPAPFDPNFIDVLGECDSNEQLFALVECKGFINPDALNEVVSRGLYVDYREWRHPPKGLYDFLADIVTKLNAPL